MKKTRLIQIVLLFCSACCLIASISLFTEGNIGAGVCGLAITAALCFFGLRNKVQPNTADGRETTDITNPAAAKPDEFSQSNFDFLRVKVAGVTFKNGRKSRQTILRKIHFKDPPFDKGNMELTLQRYEWEGAPAFGVYVNDEQIGNIPAEQVPYVQENFSRCDGITNMDVYGGGEGRNYGAEITLRFRNSNQNAVG